MRRLALALALLLTCAPALAQTAWPGTTETVIIPTEVNEFSGLAWHPGLGRVFATWDGGGWTSFLPNGTSRSTNYSTGGDTEGIAVADPNGANLYILVEDPAAIREYRISDGALLRTFTLPVNSGAGTMPAYDGSNGPEGLAFVPRPSDSEGGEFWVGHQQGGIIYRFALDLNGGTTTVTQRSPNLGPFGGLASDAAGLEYDWVSGKVWVIYDAHNRVLVLDPWEVWGGSTTAEATYYANECATADGDESVAVAGADLFVGCDYGSSGDVRAWDYARDATLCEQGGLGTALQNSVTNLANGEWCLFHSGGPSSDPRGLYSAFWINTDTSMKWMNSVPWNPVANQVQMVTKMQAEGASDNDWHYYVTYDEATNRWAKTTTGLPTTLTSGCALSCGGHAYDANALDPSTGDLYFMEYAGAPGSQTIHKRTNAGVWSTLPKPSGIQNPVSGAMAWDGTGLVAGWENNLTAALARYAGGAWSYYTPLAVSPVIQPHWVTEYDPITDYVMFGGGGGTCVYSNRVFTRAPNGSFTQAAAAPYYYGISNAATCLRANVVNDPVNGGFLMMLALDGTPADSRTPADQWQHYDPVGDEWTPYADTPGPLEFTNAQAFLVAIDEYDAVMVVGRRYDGTFNFDTYLYKPQELSAPELVTQITVAETASVGTGPKIVRLVVPIPNGYTDSDVAEMAVRRGGTKIAATIDPITHRGANVTHVLVHFASTTLASEATESVELWANDGGTIAPTNPAAANLNTGVYTLSNGLLSVTIPTTNWNVVDTVTLSGVTMIDNGASDGVRMWDCGPLENGSANTCTPTARHPYGVLDPTNWLIEEDGPMRVILSAWRPSALYDLNDDYDTADTNEYHYAGYRIRYILDAGSQELQIQYQVQNDPANPALFEGYWGQPLYFDQLDLDFLTSLGSSSTVSVGRHDGTAWSAGLSDSGIDGAELAYTDLGTYEIREQDGTLYGSESYGSNATRVENPGWVRITSGSKSILATIRHGWETYPHGIAIEEVDANTSRLSLRLWPSWSSNVWKGCHFGPSEKYTQHCVQDSQCVDTPNDYCETKFSESGAYWLDDMQRSRKNVVLRFETSDPGATQNNAIARTIRHHPVGTVPRTLWGELGIPSMTIGEKFLNQNAPEYSAGAWNTRLRETYEDQFFRKHTQQCNGGANIYLACRSDTDCPGSTCSTAVTLIDDYAFGQTNYFYRNGYRRYSPDSTGSQPDRDTWFYLSGDPRDYFYAEAAAIGALNVAREWLAEDYTFEEDGETDSVAGSPGWFGMQYSAGDYGTGCTSASNDGSCANAWRRDAFGPAPNQSGGMPLHLDDTGIMSIPPEMSHYWRHHLADWYFMSADPWAKDYWRSALEFMEGYTLPSGTADNAFTGPYEPPGNVRLRGHKMQHLYYAHIILDGETDTSTLDDVVRYDEEHLRQDENPQCGTIAGWSGGTYMTSFISRAMWAWSDYARSIGRWDLWGTFFRPAYNYANFAHWTDHAYNHNNGSCMFFLRPRQYINTDSWSSPQNAIMHDDAVTDLTNPAVQNFASKTVAAGASSTIEFFDFPAKTDTERKLKVSWDTNTAAGTWSADLSIDISTDDGDNWSTGVWSTTVTSDTLYDVAVVDVDDIVDVTTLRVRFNATVSGSPNTTAVSVRIGDVSIYRLSATQYCDNVDEDLDGVFDDIACAVKADCEAEDTPAIECIRGVIGSNNGAIAQSNPDAVAMAYLRTGRTEFKTKLADLIDGGIPSASAPTVYPGQAPVDTGLTSRWTTNGLDPYDGGLGETHAESWDGGPFIFAVPYIMGTTRADTTPPAAVTGVDTTPGGSTATISWDATAGAAYYLVTWSEKPIIDEWDNTHDPATTRQWWSERNVGTTATSVVVDTTGMTALYAAVHAFDAADNMSLLADQGEECGNGQIEGVEQCDPQFVGDLNDTCFTLGYTGGALGCYAPSTAFECQYDVSLCTTGTTSTTIQGVTFQGVTIR